MKTRTLLIFPFSLASAFESTRLHFLRQPSSSHYFASNDSRECRIPRVSALTASTSSDVINDNVQVDFPPPLSTVDRLKRAAKFWSSALPIVLSYYSLYAEMRLRETLLGESMSEEETEVR